jgi:hypothetical protein
MIRTRSHMLVQQITYKNIKNYKIFFILRWNRVNYFIFVEQHYIYQILNIKY